MDKPFTCPFCSAATKTSAGLKIHVRKKHPIIPPRKEVVANLDVLPVSARMEGFFDPYVCRSCGFCCTSRKALASHGRKYHPIRRTSLSLKRSPRKSATADLEAKDLHPFATVVEDRMQFSSSSELPPLCCSDASKKPFAIYVPIYLTEGESEILFNLTSAPETSVPETSAPEDGAEVSSDEEHLSRVVPQMNPLEEFGPQPIDVNVLNEVFEVVRNGSEFADPSAPTTRTFAISEEMLQSVDLQSDRAEVFEFAGDFQELMDRDFYLHDVGNTVEFHVVEEDGSITVKNAVRKTESRLESYSSAEDYDQLPNSSPSPQSPSRQVEDPDQFL